MHFIPVHMQASKSVVGKRVTKLHSQSARHPFKQLSFGGSRPGRAASGVTVIITVITVARAGVSAAGPTSSSHRDFDAVESRCRGRSQPRRRRAAKQSRVRADSAPANNLKSNGIQRSITSRMPS